MGARNQRIAEIDAVVEEYLALNEAIDRNELSAERLLAELREIDDETSRFADRQMVITSHLAPLFEDENHIAQVFRDGGSFAVSYDGDRFLTVRPLRSLASLVKDDGPETIRLPGREAVVSHGRPVDRVAANVTVVDQEAG